MTIRYGPTWVDGRLRYCPLRVQSMQRFFMSKVVMPMSEHWFSFLADGGVPTNHLSSTCTWHSTDSNGLPVSGLLTTTHGFQHEVHFCVSIAEP